MNEVLCLAGGTILQKPGVFHKTVNVGVPGRPGQARLRAWHGLGRHTPEGQASHIQQDHPSHTANTGAADSLPLLLGVGQDTHQASRTLKLGLGQGFSTPVAKAFFFFFFYLAPARSTTAD